MAKNDLLPKIARDALPPSTIEPTALAKVVVVKYSVQRLASEIDRVFLSVLTKLATGLVKYSA